MALRSGGGCNCASSTAVKGEGGNDWGKGGDTPSAMQPTKQLHIGMSQVRKKVTKQHLAQSAVVCHCSAPAESKVVTCNDVFLPYIELLFIDYMC